MSDATLCPARPRGTTAGLVTALAFLLVLALPAAAYAKVDAKYAQRYKNGIFGLERELSVDQETYNALVEDLGDCAGNIKDIRASDPVDESALANERARAAKGVENVAKLKGEPEQLEAAADFFQHKATPWFSSNADRIRFQGGTHNVSAGAALVSRAYLQVGEAYAALAQEMPDVGKAREHNEQATALVNQANPKFTKGLKALNALKR